VDWRVIRSSGRGYVEGTPERLSYVRRTLLRRLEFLLRADRRSDGQKTSLGKNERPY